MTRKLFGLNNEETLLQQVPYRGVLPTAVPTDPLIYRFDELVQVYGTTCRELIKEEFGDRIMSAIDFDMTITRQPDPNADRVKLTLSVNFCRIKSIKSAGGRTTRQPGSRNRSSTISLTVVKDVFGCNPRSVVYPPALTGAKPPRRGL